MSSEGCEAMAASKFHITCGLLLIGVMLLGQEQEGMAVVVACPQYCLEVDYVTCPSSGAQKLPARCNCCMTPKGCTLHLSDGTNQTCPS
ncbi:hypothetical protein EJB05_32062 [Eragrostis curvula]|uniref:Bowman-Birk serine protease inhibitors family domain-containing protein n=1 Tax=Eragrostis curvula TaxID=38414 RepID=A0A5J9UGK4_9POAL|nr:hypothetical protein EJB05_32062 [Eragrostis curvula]